MRVAPKTGNTTTASTDPSPRCLGCEVVADQLASRDTTFLVSGKHLALVGLVLLEPPLLTR